MCIPVGPEGEVQTLMMVRKTAGKMTVERGIPVAFVPLVRGRPSGQAFKPGG